MVPFFQNIKFESTFNLNSFEDISANGCEELAQIELKRNFTIHDNKISKAPHFVRFESGVFCKKVDSDREVAFELILNSDSTYKYTYLDKLISEGIWTRSIDDYGLLDDFCNNPPITLRDNNVWGRFHLVVLSENELMVLSAPLFYNYDINDRILKRKKD